MDPAVCIGARRGPSRNFSSETSCFERRRSLRFKVVQRRVGDRESTRGAAPSNKASSLATPIDMVGSSRNMDDEGSPLSTAGVATLPPRLAGHSGFQRVGARAASVPPPLPRAASVPPPLPRLASMPPPLPRASARPSSALLSGVRRSQPPPRKRRAESHREPAPPRALAAGPASARSNGPPTGARTAVPSRARGPSSSASQALHDSKFGASCFNLDPSMSALAVCNDVSPAPPCTPPPLSLSTRLEQRAADWFPTFERWLIRALDELAERAPWQRYAICAALGALIGLGAVVGLAGVFRWARAEVAAAPPSPHAVERVVARAVVAAPSAAAVAEQPAPRQALPDPVIENPAPEVKLAPRAVKHRQKRSHSQHRIVFTRRSR